MLSFEALRDANIQRLPLFTNAKGELAHTTTDGHDWSPAQWFGAVVGEMGEFARVRLQYEMGEIPFQEYREKAAKELADVATYLDILARRALDDVATKPNYGDHAQTLMAAMADIGEYANWRKKYDRGEVRHDSMNAHAEGLLEKAEAKLMDIRIVPANAIEPVKVTFANETGVQLGTAIREKFNEVSRRVGANVFIDNAGQVYSEPRIDTPLPQINMF